MRRRISLPPSSHLSFSLACDQKPAPGQRPKSARSERASLRALAQRCFPSRPPMLSPSASLALAPRDPLMQAAMASPARRACKAPAGSVALSAPDHSVRAWSVQTRCQLARGFTAGTSRSGAADRLCAVQCPTFLSLFSLAFPAFRRWPSTPCGYSGRGFGWAGKSEATGGRRQERKGLQPRTKAGPLTRAGGSVAQ